MKSEKLKKTLYSTLLAFVCNLALAYVAYGLVSGCIRDTGSRETEKHSATHNT